MSDLPKKTTPSRDGLVAYEMWHPQWGGYSSRCIVEFEEPPDPNAYPGACPPCFDVREFHDGDFPRDYETCRRHYCDAWQLLHFALNILEAQKESGHPVVDDYDDVGDVIARLERLEEE